MQWTGYLKTAEGKIAFIGVIIAIIVLILQFGLIPYLADQDTINLIHTQWDTAQNFENSNQIEKSIDINNKIIEKISIKKFPYEYARTQFFLGCEYVKLSDIENKEQNLLNSENSFNEALRVFTVKEFPTNYALTKNAIGASYAKLSDIRDKSNNLKKAIDAFNASLEVLNEKYPENLEAAYVNLGGAYQKLGTTENEDENYNKAIDSYDMAIPIAIARNDSYSYAGIKTSQSIFVLSNRVKE